MRKLKLEELGRVGVEEYKKIEKLPIVVLLDNVRSALNVGSVFRTSDALLIEKIILCGITAQPPHKDIRKSALGATESVEWEYSKNVVEAVETLKNDGYTIIAVEQADEKVWLQNFEAENDKKYAFIFGNEVKGVSNEVIPLCDYFLEIPQFGTKHSFNISVTCGMVLWEVFSKIRF